MLPKTTEDNRELLSKGHKEQKDQSIDKLQLILSSGCLFARQGLALQGNGSDESANLIQLLHLRAEDKSQMFWWLEKSACKHIVPENFKRDFSEKDPKTSTAHHSLL